jgi:hypothetical protein
MSPPVKAVALLDRIDEVLCVGGNGHRQFASFLEKQIIILREEARRILKHK